MIPENLINWGELSRILAGNRSSLYRNRISKKHKDKINDLMQVLKDWHEKWKSLSENWPT